MVKTQRLDVRRGRKVTLFFNDEPIQAFEGETLATALLAAGITAFSVTRAGQPRLPFCNMGTCFDCAVRADGQDLVRACLTDVRDGMRVEQQEGK